MPALPDTIGGEVLLKLGDDITTDHICPAGALYIPIRSNIPELSKHTFKMVDDTFAERARKANGGFVIGGSNYGQGSSRERAAMLPRYLGVQAVIARSFARLYLANVVNWGLLPLTFIEGEDWDRISQGDRLTIDTAELKEGQRVMVRKEMTKKDIAVTLPLCQEDLDSIKAGGRLNQVKKKNR
jgi:aconitate hydratase